MTPEQLRASILQQAMEGKLVKQDPNDEPASVLLEKIGEEKARLIKEKKIKRTKKLPEITDDEKPFEIPDSWEWVRLITITNFGNFKSVNGLEIPDDAWLLDMKDMNKNGGGFRQLISKNEVGSVKSNKYVVTKNDVLYGKLRPYLKKVEIAPQPGYTTTEIFPIHTIANLTLATYLRYCLLSPYFVDTVNSSMYGMKMPRVGTKFLGSMSIPLPPLAEQKRIVAKLDQLMPLVDEYAEAYDKLKKLDDGFNDKLKQSLLQYAMEGKLVKQDPNDEPASVLLEKIAEEKARLIREKKIKRTKKLPEVTDDEKPFEIPDSWEWVRLSEIGSWGAGATPSRSHPEYYGGNIPWLKTGDLNDGIVNETTETITEDGVENSSVKINKAGNVLIAMYGATIGKLGIAGKSMTTNQACCGCDIFEGVYNWYLFYYLLAMRATLVSMGAGGAQPNISKTKIEHFPFPLPPLAEQKRIVAKLDQLTAAIH